MERRLTPISIWIWIKFAFLTYKGSLRRNPKANSLMISLKFTVEDWAYTWNASSTRRTLNWKIFCLQKLPDIEFSIKSESHWRETNEHSNGRKIDETNFPIIFHFNDNRENRNFTTMKMFNQNWFFNLSPWNNWILSLSNWGFKFLHLSPSLSFHTFVLSRNQTLFFYFNLPRKASSMNKEKLGRRWLSRSGLFYWLT